MTKEQIERIDDDTPEPIEYLFQYPYKYFCSYARGVYPVNTLLDFACGNFKQKEYLEEHYHQVIGMDIDPQRPGVKQASLSNIPMRTNSVDVSFCFETIEHMDLDEQVSSIKELTRVTRPTGCVVLGSVAKDGHNYFERLEIYKGDKNPHHIRELNHVEMIDLLGRCGIVPSAFYVSVPDDLVRLRIVPAQYAFDRRIQPICNYTIWEPKE